MSPPSEGQLIQVLLEAGNAAEDPENRFNALLLAGGGLFCIAFYGMRTYFISKLLPQGHSPDLRAFATVLMVLAGWNIITSYMASRMSFTTGALPYSIGSASDTTEVKEEIAKLVINDDVSKTLNTSFLWRDMRIFLFATTSMVMLHLFLAVLLRIIEYVTLINASDKEKPLRPLTPRHRKSVSFDNTLTTYLDSRASYSELEPCESSFPDAGVLTHYGGLFALAVLVLLFVVPRSFLLNSLARIFTLGEGPVPMVEVKSDHVYVAIVVLFLRDALRKFVQVVRHPQFRNFPQMTSVFSRFTWGYSCILLAGLIALIVFLSDVLLNLFSVICEYAISDEEAFDSSPNKAPRQFVTLIIMSYLAHSLSPECFSVVEGLQCSKKGSLESLLRCFTWLRAVFVDCWVVTNSAIFLVLPLFIWVIVVELKIGWARTSLH